MNRSGLFDVIYSCGFAAGMGAFFYQAQLLEPKFSSLAGSFVRVLAAGIFLVPAIQKKGRREVLFYSPIRHPLLWLWAFFGALTVTSYFSAVSLVGNGQAAILAASSGVFTALLAPFLNHERVSISAWIAIAGSLLGLTVVFFPSSGFSLSLGMLLAVFSGLTGALAYLMIARSRGSYSSFAIALKWTTLSLFAHGILFLLMPIQFPQSQMTWSLLLIAGFLACGSQHFLTKAYGKLPATTVASLVYLAPILSLILDAMIFSNVPGPRETVGALLIVSFGLALPIFTRARG